MLECFVCHGTEGSLKALYTHFKNVHGLTRSDTYKCSQEQCSRSFSDKYTLGKHIERDHAHLLLSSPVRDTVESILSADRDAHGPEQQSGLDLCTVPDQKSCDEVAACSDPYDVTLAAARYIAESKSQLSTVHSVQTMVAACDNLVGEVVSNIEHELNSFLAKHKDALSQDAIADISAVLRTVQSSEKPFKSLSSDYKQNAYFKKAGVYIEPTEYVIGYKQTNVADKNMGVQKCVRKPLTGQFISITSMIEAFHKTQPAVISQILQIQYADALCTYFDGHHWQNSPLRNEPVILIRLYGDDFEPGNALGAQRTQYKTCCFYWQFENMTSSQLSKTENAFMVLCFKTNYIKLCSWQAAMQPLVTELIELESRGLHLEVHGELLNVKVVLGAVTGDNLFLNGVMGFVESFAAHYPCRHCLVRRTEFQTTFAEDPSTVRTLDSHNLALAADSTSETGIKFSSPLNCLLHFHSTHNYVQDIMHDLLEGVCTYDMYLVIRSLLTAGHLDNSTLNSRLQTASCCSHSSNKLPMLTSFSAIEDTLSLSATHSWMLCRLLSIAIGDLVPTDNSFWHLYIHLRQILDVVFAPRVRRSELSLLQVLIAEYLEMRRSLYPNITLKNKHHHLIHYPRLIAQFGPLIRYWCMRLESKHQRTKRIMNIVGNFKNVSRTIAVRHQHQVCNRLLQKPEGDVVIGTGESTMLIAVRDGEAISIAMDNIGLYVELFQCMWVEVNGSKYFPGAFIVVGVNADIVVFGKIVHIFARDLGQYLTFVCELFDTAYFDDHYHAWVASSKIPLTYVACNPRTMTYYNTVETAFMKKCEEHLLCSLRYRL